MPPTIDITEKFNQKGPRLVKWFIGAVAVVIGISILNPFVIVPAGNRGVVMNFGAVQKDVLGEGIHFRIPVYQKIILVDVRVQKEQTEATAASKDMQDTHSTVAVNFAVVPEQAGVVYQTIGLGYNDRVIAPVTQEVVKAITANYTAVELITQREKVRMEIREMLKERLQGYSIKVVDFSIVNFKFSAQFTQAIESKQTAEQMALKASRDLDRIKIEAQQKIAAAQAEAESLRLQKQNVSEELIKLRSIEASIKAIDKWDGKMPSVVGGAIPFIDVKSYTGGK